LFVYSKNINIKLWIIPFVIISLIFEHMIAVLFLMFDKALMDTDLVSQHPTGFFSKLIFIQKEYWSLKFLNKLEVRQTKIKIIKLLLTYKINR